jgi:hypothetical protein
MFERIYLLFDTLLPILLMCNKNQYSVTAVTAELFYLF